MTKLRMECFVTCPKNQQKTNVEECLKCGYFGYTDPTEVYCKLASKET